MTDRAADPGSQLRLVFECYRYGEAHRYGFAILPAGHEAGQFLHRIHHRIIIGRNQAFDDFRVTHGSIGAYYETDKDFSICGRGRAQGRINQ